MIELIIPHLKEEILRLRGELSARFSWAWGSVSEKTPQEFYPIIFPVSQDHQEDHQQNHLLYQKAEMPGSTRAAEGPTDKTGEPAAKEAEVPTERAFKEPTTEARLH